MQNPVERRTHVFAAAAAVNFLAVLAMIMAAITVAAVLVVILFAPEQSASAIPTIIGITLPITMALMAAGQKKQAAVTDGQMGQVLHAVAQAEHAKGMVAGIREASPDLETERRPAEP